MSFSRWCHSRWYTYADVGGGFTVCCVGNYSPEALHTQWPLIRREIQEREDATEAEMDELKGYVDAYLARYSCGESSGE